MGVTLTLNLDDATLVRLKDAAASRDISAEALAEVALKTFLSEDDGLASTPFEPWQEALIREGIEAAERGDFVSDEEVERFFSKYRS